MAYVKLDSDGFYRVYDTDYSGVISGPYLNEADAKAYCESVNQ